jgi:hypothetical protein
MCTAGVLYIVATVFEVHYLVIKCTAYLGDKIKFIWNEDPLAQTAEGKMFVVFKKKLSFIFP